MSDLRQLELELGLKGWWLYIARPNEELKVCYIERVTFQAEGLTASLLLNDGGFPKELLLTTDFVRELVEDKSARDYDGTIYNLE